MTNPVKVVHIQMVLTFFPPSSRNNCDNRQTLGNCLTSLSMFTYQFLSSLRNFCCRFETDTEVIYRLHTANR